MIYQILPDESAAKSNYIRVVDNEGEDYLYPADYFVFVEFPLIVQQALLRAPHPVMQGASGRRRRRVASQVKRGV